MSFFTRLAAVPACVVPGILLLPSAPCAAQTTFSIGPRIGYNRSTASYGSSSTSRSYQTAGLSGFEAGVAAAISFGHLSLEPALAYSQKGFSRHTEGSQYVTDVTTKLNYLVLPVSVAYTLRPDGQGAQVFAGPYVGFLLGGTYDFAAVNYNSSPPTPDRYSGNVQVGDSYKSTSHDEFSRGLDAGVQGGVGYRLGGLLVQVTYSLGLKNVAANYLQPSSPTAYNRVFQVQAAYLFGPKG